MFHLPIQQRPAHQAPGQKGLMGGGRATGPLGTPGSRSRCLIRLKSSSTCQRARYRVNTSARDQSAAGKEVMSKSQAA